jgi:hypothetical protein
MNPEHRIIRTENHTSCLCGLTFDGYIYEQLEKAKQHMNIFNPETVHGYSARTGNKVNCLVKGYSK